MTLRRRLLLDLSGVSVSGSPYRSGPEAVKRNNVLIVMYAYSSGDLTNHLVDQALLIHGRCRVQLYYRTVGIDMWILVPIR